MIKETVEKVTKRMDLTGDEMRACFEEIMSGEAGHADIVVFLDGLRKKGETVEEITAAALVMREKSFHIKVDGGGVMDTCGTGGTGLNTFNISTIAAFVVAGCGVRVAKHGNRSSSGHCGSADVLEALGVKINIELASVAKCIKEIGVGFMFAPAFHAAMKHAAGPRKELGGKTIFNILGPLSNPAGATRQVIGVYDAKLTETLAGVLMNLGSGRAFVVHGSDGLDEITIAGSTKISELDKGKIKTYEVTPGDFGLKRAPLEEIKGAGPKENAEIVISILKGERSARRDIVLANAAASLVCAGKAKDFKEGVVLAAGSIDSGKALDKLQSLIEFTNR